MISPKFTYKGNWDIENKCDLWAAKMMQKHLNIKNPWDVAYDTLEIIDGLDYETTLSQVSDDNKEALRFKVKKGVVRAYLKMLGVQFHPPNEERRERMRDGVKNFV